MRNLLLVLTVVSLGLSGCASARYSSYQADLVPGHDPDIPSDWNVLDVNPKLLTAKRWGEPVEDIADFW